MNIAKLYSIDIDSESLLEYYHSIAEVYDFCSNTIGIPV